MCKYFCSFTVQYISDPYACVLYVVSDIGKAQSGMSKLLKDALLHYIAGDTTIKERLRGIASKFQNCSEVSPQEVSYHLLSLPLSKCSLANDTNTGPADKRVRILKSKPPDAIKVLLAAPTGKAAHNIHDVKLHSAFVLPVMEFGGEIPNLSSDVLNTLRCRLLCLKLIIMYEISMVGSEILSQVNSRLKAILAVLDKIEISWWLT